MFEDSILNVAFGLIFLYALLSLITTSVTEAIATAFSARARALRGWLESFLGEGWTGPRGREQGIAHDFLRHPAIRGLSPRDDDAPDYIPAETFTASLLELLARPDEHQLRQRPHSYAELREMIARIQESPYLRQLLLTLTANSRGSLDEAERAIARWYDSSMDRLRGWYARRAQAIAFMTAFGLTALLNADTLMVADALWQDSSLQDAVVAQAEAEAKGETSAGEGLSAEELARMQELSAFPLGWSMDELDRRSLPDDALGWVQKLIGLMLTVFATTLGAPFWFGLLSKVVDLRSTGKPPERTPARPEREEEHIVPVAIPNKGLSAEMLSGPPPGDTINTELR